MQKMKEDRLQKIEDYNRLRRNIVEVSTADNNIHRQNILFDTCRYYNKRLLDIIMIDVCKTL